MPRKKITDLLGSELADLQTPKASEQEIPASVVSKEAELQSTEASESHLPEENKSPSTKVEKTQTVDSSANVSKRTESKPLSSKNSVSLEEADSETLDIPKYLQLERKEVRLRLDQMDSLTALIRRLNKLRKGRGERLTENTLIRIAVDLLLENSSQLQGTTEDELLASLGLPPSDSH